jgi:hypothetical protein
MMICRISIQKYVQNLFGINFSSIMRWQVDDVVCLHVERNHVMGSSYLDTPSVLVRKAKFSNILAQCEFSLALNFHVKTLTSALQLIGKLKKTLFSTL